MKKAQEQGYLSSEELAAKALEGVEFAARIGGELADYSVQSAVRLNNANEYLSAFEPREGETIMSLPDPKILKAIKAEKSEAEKRFLKTRKAAESILGIDAADKDGKTPEEATARLLELLTK